MLIYDQEVSVHDPTSDNLRIYPNPSNVMSYADGLLAGNVLEISDMTGGKHTAQTCKNRSARFELRLSGLYTVRVSVQIGHPIGADFQVADRWLSGFQRRAEYLHSVTFHQHLCAESHVMKTRIFRKQTDWMTPDEPGH